MRCPPASVLGDAADGAAAPPVPSTSGGAPPSLAGAKKSLGGTGSPPKSWDQAPADTHTTEKMKASMAATGGMLSLSSTTYRYYQLTGTGASEDPNVSCRVKSLKGNNPVTYSVSTGSNLGISSVQFRIGSVLYPQSAIEFSNTNKGELFQEIRKCFGTIGSYNHGTMLNDATFQQADDQTAGHIGISGSQRSLWFAAYDFETFAKSATESGINVSDRALPVTLSLKKIATTANVTVAGRYDTFAMCDCIIYIDLMGRITTRI
eukprot:COSAG01_NODE_464_length_16617_cov_126.274428_3_plen_263_part_00